MFTAKLNLNVSLDVITKLANLIRIAHEDIELVPGTGEELWPASDNANHPFCLTDGHLAVPIKFLYQTYIASISLFDIPGAPLEDLTLVILLVNPDHNTALNARKNQIRNGALREADELAITASLLSVPRNSKSTLLWHHRRWLLLRLHNSLSSNVPTEGVSEDEGFMNTALPLASLRGELLIVKRAASVYNRNYHAWNHRYMCLRSCASPLGQTNHRDEGGTDEQERRAFIRQEYFDLTNWANTHISDGTSMQYLSRIVEVALQKGIDLLDSHSWAPNYVLSKEATIPYPIEHALSLVLTYPSHESVWVYLRHVLFLIGDGETGIQWIGLLSPLKEEDVVEVRDVSHGSVAKASEAARIEVKRALVYKKRFLRQVGVLDQIRESRPSSSPISTDES